MRVSRAAALALLVSSAGAGAHDARAAGDAGWHAWSDELWLWALLGLVGSLNSPRMIP